MASSVLKWFCSSLGGIDGSLVVYMKTSLILLFAVVLATGSSANPPPPVMTETGLIQGVAERDLTVYKGVPFAAAPVGELRWRAPQPAASWEGVRLADSFGPDPYQGDGQGHVSEDCLYLNIWTPAQEADAKVPVLVWIYGGGFSFGSNTTPVHNGEHLARKGVVLVTINYRVGPLGFLAHSELSAESPRRVSGNWGLLDQLAALRWVQRNIAAFGGDPENVTIFGESAGGISVSMLCASPEAKGLFRRAISQSGGSFGPPRRTTYPGENMRRLAWAEESGGAYLQRAGVTTIAELRQLPPERLPAGWGSGAAWPIIDGWIIPDDQHRLYQSGTYNEVDILVGYNSDEGLSFARERTPEEYRANVEQRYGPFAEKLLAAYPATATAVPKSARDLMRDAAFGWHTWSWATLQAETGRSNVYYYYFDQHAERPADGPTADHGMPHGVDVPYVFQTLNREGQALTTGDRAISEIVATYWTNFAKHGDPNGDGVPFWPPYTKDARRVMYFKDTARPGPVPDADALAVLDAYYAWRRTPEGEAWAK
jgi:para-nitrobenzyl esterase